MFTLVIPPDSPCGCGSGKMFGSCCLRDNRIILSQKSVTPPLPPTGLVMDRCGMATYRDCCDKMSRDHIMSKAVLGCITDDTISISSPEYTRTSSIKSDSLQTKWLCRRHNSALGPLDSEAKRFFQAVAAADQALSSPSPDSQKAYLFHAYDLERWLLKTLMAAYNGQVSNIGKKTHTLPDYLPALFQEQLPPPYGLYFQVATTGTEQQKLTIHRHAAIKLITYNSSVAGVSVALCGLELKLYVAGPTADLQKLQDTHVHRPQCINFFKERDVVSIVFIGLPKSSKPVWLSHGDPNANPPTD